MLEFDARGVVVGAADGQAAAGDVPGVGGGDGGCGDGGVRMADGRWGNGGWRMADFGFRVSNLEAGNNGRLVKRRISDF